jgi:hypothetical protein
MTQHALISRCEDTKNILQHQIISYVFAQQGTAMYFRSCTIHNGDGSSHLRVKERFLLCTLKGKIYSNRFLSVLGFIFISQMSSIYTVSFTAE